MEPTKSKWASKGVWGGIVGLLASAASAFLHLPIDAGTQAEVAGHVTQIADAAATGNWPGLITAAVAAIGSGFAIYGRIMATRELR